MKSCRSWVWTFCLGALGLVFWLSVPAPAMAEDKAPPATGVTPAKNKSLPDAVQARITAILDSVEKGNDCDPALKDANDLFQEVVAYVPEPEARVFREAAYARRLVYQLSKADPKRRVELLKFLRKNDDFARTLIFLMPGQTKLSSTRETKAYGQTIPTSAHIMAMADRLIQERADKLNAYASLAAAICVVHATPLIRQVNENKTTAPDPLALFDFYTTNEKLMLFGIKPVPAELLIWMVDDTASVEDMKWALDKYKGDQAVGKRFFDIKYDYDYYRSGKTKKVNQAGYNLPNLLRCGGICADQTFFAMSVGKAIGVPTAYAVGRGGDMGHAWVGFFQNKPPVVGWNFKEGRYQEYKAVRGSVMDPQTRLEIPDSYVALQAEMLGTKTTDRQITAAFTDAAVLLLQAEKDRDKWDPQPSGTLPESSLLPKARTPNVDTELALLEAGLRRFYGYTPGWYVLQHLADDKQLTLAHKRRWADIVQKLCGVKYPDFALDLLAPMVSTVEDPKEQNALWEAIFTLFPKRADLSAEVRMAQAKMWEKAGNNANAFKCCEDVIAHYANAGPFIREILGTGERLLKADGKEKQVPALYEKAWALLDKPDRSATADIRKESNWYFVGTRYMQLLKEAGESDKADKAKAAIEKEVGSTNAK